MADAGAITTSTLMFVADADWVVKKSAQETFFKRLSSPVKELVRLPGFYHAIFHERERRRVVAKTREFILKCFEQVPQRSSLMEADHISWSQDRRNPWRIVLPGCVLRGRRSFCGRKWALR